MQRISAEGFAKFVGKMNIVISVISGVGITFVMSLMVLNILGRTIGYPIIGTYDIVGLSGALIMGCAIPVTSWARQHVVMDFVVDNLPSRFRKILSTITRGSCAVLFIVISVNLFRIAEKYHSSGQISTTLKLPLHPFAYLIGICCLLQSFVFVCNIITIWSEKNE